MVNTKTAIRLYAKEESHHICDSALMFEIDHQLSKLHILTQQLHARRNGRAYARMKPDWGLGEYIDPRVGMGDDPESRWPDGEDELRIAEEDGTDALHKQEDDMLALNASLRTMHVQQRLEDEAEYLPTISRNVNYCADCTWDPQNRQYVAWCDTHFYV